MRAPAIIVVLALCAAARAEAPSAATLAKRGVQALRAQDYATAATAFQQSYALEPKAATVCNLALTYDRWAGHVAEAIESYRKCAEDDDSGRFRDHALERARQLREQLASTPPPVEPKPQSSVTPPPAEPKPPPPVEPKSQLPVEPKPQPPVAANPQPTVIATPPPVVTPPAATPPAVTPPAVAVVHATEPPPRTRSFFRDPAACFLTALGIAGVAGGVGLAVAGKLDDNDVATTGDLGQKTILYNRAGVLEPAGYVTLGVGVALVVAGVVEWAAHGRHVQP